MKIKNIEIRNAAVTLIYLGAYAPMCCDTCDDEEGQFEVKIKTSWEHVHVAVGPYCAEKYVRALAVA